MDIVIPTSRGKQRHVELQLFADALIRIDRQTGFKVSSRGWCYQLENLGAITKGDFDRIQTVLNKMRKKGYLPIDFTAQDDSRSWYGVESPTTQTPIEWLATFLKASAKCWDTYSVDWWNGEEYYIQMMVEKIDLKTLFKPICQDYHIPIATAKGWSDINQRAEMAWRFKEAEEKGLKPVLLYCGDFDPFGAKIGDTVKKNMWDIAKGTVWMPTNLQVDRFGLNLDFIEANHLSWIENLETASGLNLASPSHPQHHLPEVQEWLEDVGPRKVEANALVVAPRAGRELCRGAIERWLGLDALNRFQSRRDAIREEIEAFDERTGVLAAIQEALNLIEGEEGER